MTAKPKGQGDELFALFDLGLLQNQGLDDWLGATLSRCARWFRASGGSVFLMRHDGKIEMRCHVGKLSQVPPGTLIELGQGVAGTVLLEGTPRLVGDPTNDAMFKGRGVSRRREIASAMVVPMLGPARERIGVINLSRSSGEEPFCDSDLGQAEKLGAHMALAVTNAKLVDLLKITLGEVNRRVEELQAVLGSVAARLLVFDETGFIGDLSDMSPGLAEACVECAGRTLETGSTPETRVTDPETGTTWLLRGVSMSQGGGLVTLVDVSDYQRAQDEAARLRRLAEIGQMTAGIAHEIRNPLTGIRGAAQLIKSDSSLAAEYSQVIEEEAEKLERLCDDFLEISRPLKLERRPASLNHLAHRVAELWKPEFDQAGIVLTLESENNDPTIDLDVRRVEQVVHNLVRNAMQACGPGGTVRLKVSNNQLSVSDNGSGMDDETLQRLFSPFFTTKSQGTGLGLCNLRRIVDAHGGRVDVWSKPGEGTRFDVRFSENAA